MTKAQILRGIHQMQAGLAVLESQVRGMSTFEDSIGVARGMPEIAGFAIALLAKNYCVPAENFPTRRRTEDIAWPRQILFYILRETTDMTLSEIGDLMNRDHGTVLHGIHHVRDRMETEPPVRAAILGLLEQVREEAILLEFQRIANGKSREGSA